MANENKLKVLHVYRSLKRNIGGPATSVPALCRNLSYNGCDVSILTIHYDPNDVEDPGNSEIIKLDKDHNIRSLIKRSDIVHIHGVWPLLPNEVMRQCRFEGKNYIVSPRASLMLSDINKTCFKIFKKYAAWKLFIKNNLIGASGFHVTAKIEFDDLALLKFRGNAAIIPNGINVSEFISETDKEKLYKFIPKAKGKRILLFFSRVAPTKGLLLLAHAWGKVAKANPSWHLVIAGPDNENHWPQVKSILDGYDKSRYTRIDYLRGEERLAVLRYSDLFVLPTYWENFGIVVAESLMACTPVITTTKTPWTELESIGCGWTIEPEIAALEKVLRKTMNIDRHILAEMGQKGREYVMQKFNWRTIADDMKRYYEYILGYGEKPEFVYELQGNGKPSLPIRKPIRLIR